MPTAVFHDDMPTLAWGASRRILYQKQPDGSFGPFHRSDRESLEEVYGEFKRKLEVWRKSRPTTAQLSVEQFVNRYKGRKRRIYEVAAQDYQHEPFITPKDAHIRGFIKREKTPSAEEKDPRIIQPRSPKFNLIWGRWYFPLEHELYNDLDQLFYDQGAQFPVVAKRYNVKDLAALIWSKWGMFRRPVAILMDGSRFDSTVGPDNLDQEHDCYELYLPEQGKRTARRVRRMQKNNKCTYICKDGTISHKHGQRCSGDANTGGGNVVLCCGCIYECNRQTGVKTEWVDNGDDLFSITEERDAEFVGNIFTTITTHAGYKYRVEGHAKCMEEIEFCQQHPVWNGTEYIMCRGPKGLLKDGIVRKPVRNNVEFRRWLATIGECGMAVAPGIPVMQSFYSCMTRNSRGAKVFDKDEMFQNTTLYRDFKALGEKKGKARPVGVEARASFYRAFGMVPDVQEQLEEYYDSLNFGYDPGTFHTNIPVTTLLC